MVKGGMSGEWPGERHEGRRGMVVWEGGAGDFGRRLGIWNFELEYRVLLEIKMEEKKKKIHMC